MKVHVSHHSKKGIYFLNMRSASFCIVGKLVYFCPNDSCCMNRWSSLDMFLFSLKSKHELVSPTTSYLKSFSVFKVTGFQTGNGGKLWEKSLV